MVDPIDLQRNLLQKELQNKIHILENKKILRGLLSDCFLGNKAKVNQLIAGFDCGVIDKLLITQQRSDFFKDHLTGMIKKDHGYDENVAGWVVDVWLSCIDENVIVAYKRHLEVRESLNIPPENLEVKLRPSAMEGFFVPCGVGSNDEGFVVHGLEVSKACEHKHSSIFAVIFNYLQRNRIIDEKRDKPQYIKQYEKGLHFEIDYRMVYRLMVIILLMVKNNCAYGDVLYFDYDGESEEIEAAFLCLNNYIMLIGRLAGIKDITQLKYQKSSEFKVTLRDSSGNVTVSEHKGKQTNRVIWDAPKILYRINDETKVDLEYLLREISPYNTFRTGQFEALRDMLNCQAHAICIMPTGSGKSLIFYFCAILQPGVSFVISPTELLIYDQIENLKNTHRFDDVNHLKYDRNYSFANFPFENKIYYLTPETFQNRDLLKEFIELNSNKKIANIILDEVHCISNWSHDFRPEYLMLSSYLNEYLDRTYYRCFTATADYTVIRDIKHQLQLVDENIISPVELKRNNIKFTFLACDTTDEMINCSVDYLKKNLIKGQKSLVFTKSDDVSNLFHGALGEIKYESVLYKKDDRTAYKTFASGQCKILIASEEIGIGINLNDIQNVLHFGLPISKGEYVQQFGRVGRCGERATSLVVYLSCLSENVDEILLHRNTTTAKVIDILNSFSEQNDYFDAYIKLVGSIRFHEKFMHLLSEVYKTVRPITDHREINFSKVEIDNIKKCLYILFVIGYVNNWSTCDLSPQENSVGLLVGVNEENQTLSRVKERTRDYLYQVGGNKESISLIGGASSMQEILEIYIDWYYNHFIYHHKEQFLDMLSFFESYKSDNRGVDYSKEINSRLASYFSLSMLEISRDEAKYAKLSFKEIAESIISGIDYSTVSNIQHINQDSHSIKLDYFLFVYSLIYDDEFDFSRMVRILNGMEKEMFVDFLESVSLIYEKTETNNRIHLFRAIENYVYKKGFNYGTFFDMVFRENKRDIVYFGVLAKKINTIMGEQENVS